MPPEWQACDHSLTTLYYMGVGFVVWLPLFPLAAYLHPPGPGRHQAWVGFAVLITAVIAISSPLTELFKDGMQKSPTSAHPHAHCCAVLARALCAVPCRPLPV